MSPISVFETDIYFAGVGILCVLDYGKTFIALRVTKSDQDPLYLNFYSFLQFEDIQAHKIGDGSYH